jgi:hypothetical protein
MRTMGTPPNHYAWFIQPETERLSELKRVDIDKLVWQYLVLIGATAALLVLARSKTNRT